MICIVEQEVSVRKRQNAYSNDSQDEQSDKYSSDWYQLYEETHVSSVSQDHINHKQKQGTILGRELVKNHWLRGY